MSDEQTPVKKTAAPRTGGGKRGPKSHATIVAETEARVRAEMEEKFAAEREALEALRAAAEQNAAAQAPVTPVDASVEVQTPGGLPTPSPEPQPDFLGRTPAAPAENLVPVTRAEVVAQQPGSDSYDASPVDRPVRPMHEVVTHQAQGTIPQPTQADLARLSEYNTASPRQISADELTADPSAPEAVTINFVVDGFTALGKVWYRGEEITLAPGTEQWNLAQLNDGTGRTWAHLDEDAQIDKYGERKFRPGLWKGRALDINDPDLTEEERHRLRTQNEKRLQRTGF
jgi:hypothetical protein